MSWYQKKGLLIRHLYVKYQRPLLFGSKDAAHVEANFADTEGL
jgi:hypothetical protein